MERGQQLAVVGVAVHASLIKWAGTRMPSHPAHSPQPPPFLQIKFSGAMHITGLLLENRAALKQKAEFRFYARDAATPSSGRMASLTLQARNVSVESGGAVRIPTQVIGLRLAYCYAKWAGDVRAGRAFAGACFSRHTGVPPVPPLSCSVPIFPQGFPTQHMVLRGMFSHVSITVLGRPIAEAAQQVTRGGEMFVCACGSSACVCNRAHRALGLCLLWGSVCDASAWTACQASSALHIKPAAPLHYICAALCRRLQTPTLSWSRSLWRSRLRRCRPVPRHHHMCPPAAQPAGCCLSRPLTRSWCARCGRRCAISAWWDTATTRCCGRGQASGSSCCRRRAMRWSVRCVVSALH